MKKESPFCPSCRRIEQELQDAQTQMKNLEKQVKRLKSSRNSIMTRMSHDINNVLTCVETTFELLGRKKLCSEELELIRGVRSSTARLQSLLKNLQTKAEIVQGRLRLVCSSINATAFLGDTQRHHQAIADERRVSLFIAPIGHIPNFVSDQSKLMRVLDNLIGNALKFTPQGGSVCVFLRQISPKMLQFEITDTGHGVNKQDETRIFQTFQQGAGAEGAEGFGLGLSIVVDLLMILSGSIELDSQHTSGARFLVKIPISPDHVTPGPSQD